MQNRQVLAARECRGISSQASLAVSRPEQVHQVAGRAKAHADPVTNVVDDAQHADDRSRIDRAAVGLVVKAHVAGYHRRGEYATGLGHAANRLLQLEIHLRFFRVAEVQAVGHGDRFGSGADDVARGFGNGDRAASVRVEEAETAVAVCRECDAAMGALQPQHRRVAISGSHDGVCHHLVVILAVDPAL